MSASLYLELGWLPRAPADFTRRCRALANSTEPADEPAGEAIAALARHALDGAQLNRLAGVIGGALANGRDLAPLVPLTLGLICNATTDTLRAALVATAARHGFALNCVCAGYNQVVQDALSPTSALNLARPDLVLLALDHRALPMQPMPGNDSASAEMIEAAFQHVDLVVRGVRQNSGAVALVQTLARPPETLFGSLDYRTAGTWRTLCEGFNRRLADSLDNTPNLLLDVAGLAETVGLAAWHDPSVWNLAKLPFADDALPLYADHVCRVIAAWRGRSRRCLILDLDNTVWGGVIGDDGIDNIRIAEGDAVGEAHRCVQAAALALRERGVVLAVSSKNDDDVARGPFRSHPEMMLREEHIAVFQANWQDKATNITAIARELSLGLESMAFLDDNPAERGLVRGFTSQVFVPEVGDDPALFARTLSASGAFEATLYSDEDRARAGFYQANARRIALQQQAGDLDAYLRSLDMEIVFRRFDASGRARIAQLIGKSNQFNLTTRRYSEADVEAFENDPDCVAWQIRLKDVFADNGMICVLIARPRDGALAIDTWLMSCRVLGRKVETAVLQKLCAHAQAAGLRTIVGEYRPTARNRMVEQHYANFGFALAGTRADGSTWWALDADHAPDDVLPMRVVDLTPDARALNDA
ncbi:HAD-IIIC family phosphatase [Paraburkholderia caballeronis]|uniref:HAD-superfamily phosphatase, subfamily IIIC/FkbH-like domain-containing protein n=1 Tax=Paraburkholderia caballeronis TaxID=416943 RepID=A0A1H7JVL6_9BURK|nr:HAD-IIIC family phosphatase [Paraburkholderia caballeronis]PXW27251.1 HAD superfamily phosphatase (TIGR01681 family)/FkbH-like protein [Paraburkholderia caballeronis]PXX02725.1 HAD superfamily phosphatase (TIGR01681 family)/FkbH-like protein [Paraburkholderia caballeronis]RAK03450.1 HAD superfamily phosphatase (TIGR01681 family)/FkbH-like protein [Paraburkholderia caballeronis]SEC39945.1 HAD-superfamily phosphatase, subfamily IIIC/FkbH-like domain-containing protein [Paraburkholderia caballe